MKVLLPDIKNLTVINQHCLGQRCRFDQVHMKQPKNKLVKRSWGVLDRSLGNYHGLLTCSWWLQCTAVVLIIGYVYSTGTGTGNIVLRVPSHTRGYTVPLACQKTKFSREEKKKGQRYKRDSNPVPSVPCTRALTTRPPLSSLAAPPFLPIL